MRLWGSRGGAGECGGSKTGGGGLRHMAGNPNARLGGQNPWLGWKTCPGGSSKVKKEVEIFKKAHLGPKRCVWRHLGSLLSLPP